MKSKMLWTDSIPGPHGGRTWCWSYDKTVYNALTWFVTPMDFSLADSLHRSASCCLVMTLSEPPIPISSSSSAVSIETLNRDISAILIKASPTLSYVYFYVSRLADCKLLQPVKFKSPNSYCMSKPSKSGKVNFKIDEPHIPYSTLALFFFFLIPSDYFITFWTQTVENTVRGVFIFICVHFWSCAWNWVRN